MNEPSPKREFRTEVEIDAPADAVWRAITDDQELRRWFAPEASVDAKIGGDLSWRWADVFIWDQKIEVLEPGVRLRTRYDSPVADGAGGQVPLFVDFHLESNAGRTTLRLVHSGFGTEAAFDEEYDGISRGWSVELQSLRLYLERHAGQDRQLAWTRARLSLPASEVWRRLTAPDALACGDLSSKRPGDPFRFETAEGDVFEGETVGSFSTEFEGIDRTHDDAFFRIWTKEWDGAALLWLWHASYGRPEREVQSLQNKWDALVERLFGSERVAAAKA